MGTIEELPLLGDGYRCCMGCSLTLFKPRDWQPIVNTQPTNNTTTKTKPVYGVLVVCLALLICLDSLEARESVSKTLFMDAVPIADIQLLTSWHVVIDQMEVEQEQVLNCIMDKDSCSGKLRSIALLITRSEELNPDQKIRLVNRYINRFTRYRADPRETISLNNQEFGVSQQWVSLLEFLRRGGDCEDYATAKYQLLRMVGFEASDLQVVVVYDRTNRDHHAVVAVRTNSEKALLLDTDNRVYQYRPVGYRYVYAVNENHVWDHGIEDTRLPRRIRKALETVD